MQRGIVQLRQQARRQHSAMLHILPTPTDYVLRVLQHAAWSGALAALTTVLAVPICNILILLAAGVYHATVNVVTDAQDPMLMTA